jgi:hypothetical protein
MFDFKKFLLDHWTDAEKVVEFLMRYGIRDVTPAAANKWFLRESVPAQWLATLLVLLELERGMPLSLQPYLKPDG